jgi:hypothetical protein
MEKELTGSCYVVHTNVTAIRYSQDGRSRFVTIPRGAVFAVTGTFKDFGVIEIRYQGEALSVFSRDILERTERMK